MTYRTLGLMSGSSLDGLDIAFIEFIHDAGKWSYEIVAADCYTYDEEWKLKLQTATALPAADYLLLHAAYGHYIGKAVLQFINQNNLQFKVGLIASHGHTTFHYPGRMTAQLGDGAAIAAVTGLPVISDLRALDVAFGGQGAPIVPIGEKLLLPEYDFYLNLGGIANISFQEGDNYIAYDICPANRVLNMIAATQGKEYDAGGEMASQGIVHAPLLEKLNALPYYGQPFPKSLANSFGVDEVYPLVHSFSLSPYDELRTCVQHIVLQITKSVENSPLQNDHEPAIGHRKLLVTGGGAFNTFLVEELRKALQPLHVEIVIPDAKLVQYKEALIMALIGVLRWRQEYNVLSSVTGAARNSIGGAVWIGQEG